MAGKRKGISKKTRFEVFKRDGFTCQYCGGTPPKVVLQVDHIVPVASGGENHMDNYVTSCQPCNLGKGVGDLQTVPQSLSDKAAEVAERESQLVGYQQVLQARRDRLEDEMWNIAEMLDPGCGERGMKRDYTSSIRMFIERIGYFEVLDAVDATLLRFPRADARQFKYFCGVCWNKVRRAEEGANA